MARPKRQTLVVRQFLGMNLSDPDISLLPDQARRLENVDLFDGGLGQRRAGFVQAPTAGTPPTSLTRAILAVHKHSPVGSDMTAELWVAVSMVGVPSVLSANIYRWSAGAWSVLTLPDFPNGDPEVSFATFNTKLFIAYASAENRLHVWDGVSLRRVGLAPPIFAPGLANLGAGALAFTRWYRVRFLANVGNPTTALSSEAGPSATITVAASAGVQVTRPPLVDQNEGAWVVEASNTANGPWFQLPNSVQAIGTLTFNDTNATIPTTAPAPEAGLFTLPPSCKYLSVYRQQLLMAGAWEPFASAGQTIPKTNRVWFTRPLHALDVSDDESVPSLLTIKFWADLSEDGDLITGLSYALEGTPFAFKRRQVWGLIPTDDVTVPFRTVHVTDAVGCIDYRTICMGEDEQGNPALYFVSLRGPYRTGRSGLQYLGRDFETVTGSFSPRTATRALWASDLRQVWYLNPNENCISRFNVRYGRPVNGDVRYGWTQDFITAFPNILTLGEFNQGFLATQPGLPQQPVIGGFSGLFPTITTALWQRDPTVDTDNGGGYFAFVDTPAYTFGELLQNVALYPPRVYASRTETVGALTFTLECNIAGNFEGPPMGASTLTQALVFAGPPFLTGVRIGTFHALQWSDAEVYRVRLGDVDGSAVTGWRLIALMVPYQLEEEAE